MSSALRRFQTKLSSALLRVKMFSTAAVPGSNPRRGAKHRHRRECESGRCQQQQQQQRRNVSPATTTRKGATHWCRVLFCCPVVKCGRNKKAESGGRRVDACNNTVASCHQHHHHHHQSKQRHQQPQARSCCECNERLTSSSACDGIYCTQRECGFNPASSSHHHHHHHRRRHHDDNAARNSSSPPVTSMFNMRANNPYEKAPAPAHHHKPAPRDVTSSSSFAAEKRRFVQAPPHAAKSSKAAESTSAKCAKKGEFGAGEAMMMRVGDFSSCVRPPPTRTVGARDNDQLAAAIHKRCDASQADSSPSRDDIAAYAPVVYLPPPATAGAIGPPPDYSDPPDYYSIA